MYSKELVKNVEALSEILNTIVKQAAYTGPNVYNHVYKLLCLLKGGYRLTPKEQFDWLFSLTRQYEQYYIVVMIIDGKMPDSVAVESVAALPNDQVAAVRAATDLFHVIITDLLSGLKFDTETATEYVN